MRVGAGGADELVASLRLRREPRALHVAIGRHVSALRELGSEVRHVRACVYIPKAPSPRLVAAGNYLKPRRLVARSSRQALTISPPDRFRPRQRSASGSLVAAILTSVSARIEPKIHQRARRRKCSGERASRASRAAKSRALLIRHISKSLAGQSERDE